MKTLQKKQIVSILFLFIYGLCLAQTYAPRQQYWTFGFNLGCLGFAPTSSYQNYGYNFTQTYGATIAHNGRGKDILSATTSLGLNTGYLWRDKSSKNFTAIQLDFQQNRNSYKFNHPYKRELSSKQNNDNDADDSIAASWVENDLYLKYAIAIERYWAMDQYIHSPMNAQVNDNESYWYLKASFGQTFCHRNNGQPINLNHYEESADNQGNIITDRTIAFNPKSYMIGTEIGIRNFSQTSTLDVGLAFYIPLSKTYTQEYEFLKASPSTNAANPAPQTVGKEQISFGGSSILLNVTYRFNTPLESKKRKPVEPKVIEPIQPIVHNHKPHTFNDRKVKVQESINLGDSAVMAEVWDKGIVDGDKISLYLNGTELLHNFTVGKIKKEIVLHLNPGKNYLILHALNLGRIPPNTAAIDINDGFKTTHIVLNSDLKRSGALEIDYTPPKS